MFSVNVGNSSSDKALINCGAPQGSILGHYESKSTNKENQLWSKLHLFLDSISLEQLAE